MYHASTVENVLACSARYSSENCAAPQVLAANVCIPAGIVGSSVFYGKFSSIPFAGEVEKRAPLVVFLPGSSGQRDNIGTFQMWLAEELGVASIAPDCFSMSDRPVHESSTSLEVNKQLHSFYLSEIEAALSALPLMQWVDSAKLILAGTSEGAIAAARWKGRQFCARIIYSWSCENHNLLDQPHIGFGDNEAILNILSCSDSDSGEHNSRNKNHTVIRYCENNLKVNYNSIVAHFPDAPHALFNLPSARWLTAYFIKTQLKK